MFSKRVTGWVNVRLLGRGRRFKHANDVVAALLRATSRHAEFDHARLLRRRDHAGVRVRDARPRPPARASATSHLPPGFAVPGNHDYYTRAVPSAAGLLRGVFAPWQHGERVGDEHYPFARKVGHVWLIGVNSRTAEPLDWDASGAVGADQLERLRELCAPLDAGPRIVVTHYPLRTAHGQVESRVHRLRDHAAALAAAAECGVGLWLHGHIHRGFVLPAVGRRSPSR